MPIQINNVNAIDDNRNFSAAGIVTVGSGSSVITINGSTSIVNVGSGITLSGSNGSISIAGTISASSLNIPVQVSSFSPAIGATGVSGSTKIILTFNQTVGLGTTGFVQIKIGSATTGANNQTIYPVNTTLSNGGTVLNLNNSEFPDATNLIFPVMSSGFVVANGNNFAGINTVGSATTYSFRTKPVALGDSFGGGFLICQSGGTRWVVAPSSSQVTRTWYSRTDSNTTAQSVSGCTGWFVPTSGQLQNPGFTCRIYWDTYVADFYWSDTQSPGTPQPAPSYAFKTSMVNGNSGLTSKNENNPVRSFRCVAY